MAVVEPTATTTAAGEDDEDDEDDEDGDDDAKEEIAELDKVEVDGEAGDSGIGEDIEGDGVAAGDAYDENDHISGHGETGDMEH